MKYIAKWSTYNNDSKYIEFDPILQKELSFFSEENGYSIIDIQKIKKMKIGEILDFSDGISQIHEIECISDNFN